MEHPGFYKNTGPYTLSHIAEVAQATLGEGCDPDFLIHDIRPLQDAGEGQLSFLDNTKYLKYFKTTKSSACFIHEKFTQHAPENVSLLFSSVPYRSYARALNLFYPQASLSLTTQISSSSPGGSAAEHADIGENVDIEQSAVIGAEARIGAGTKIASGAIIGARVYIGKNCYIGPNTVITNSLIGDNVIIHSGVSIGQDGFGFAMGADGHLKVPQIGRVIIQDDVEIGANTTIDRGALGDTMVGKGSKIDNLVQIGHNVVIGNHCVIVSQTGISGSSVLEDFVVLGGQVGVVGHVRIGMGSQIAGSSNVNDDVPPGSRWGGTPAKPMKVWFKEITLLRRMAEPKYKK